MLKLITPSMKAFLMLISLLIMPICSGMSQTNYSIDAKTYRMNIGARGQDISGIAIMEFSSTGNVIGTIVNDFGIKIFDFISNEDKTKIMNAIAPLNKWYIKRVLRKDLGFILLSLRSGEDVPPSISQGKTNRTLEISDDGIITLTNNRYKIIYTFSLITGNNEVSE